MIEECVFCKEEIGLSDLDEHCMGRSRYASAPCKKYDKNKTHEENLLGLFNNCPFCSKRMVHLGGYFDISVSCLNCDYSVKPKGYENFLEFLDRFNNSSKSEIESEKIKIVKNIPIIKPRMLTCPCCGRG